MFKHQLQLHRHIWKGQMNRQRQEQELLIESSLTALFDIGGLEPPDTT
jgi:hypothetical protein